MIYILYAIPLLPLPILLHTTTTTTRVVDNVFPLRFSTIYSCLPCTSRPHYTHILLLHYIHRRRPATFFVRCIFFYFYGIVIPVPFWCYLRARAYKLFYIRQGTFPAHNHCLGQYLFLGSSAATPSLRNCTTFPRDRLLYTIVCGYYAWPYGG